MFLKCWVIRDTGLSFPTASHHRRKYLPTSEGIAHVFTMPTHRCPAPYGKCPVCLVNNIPFGVLSPLAGILLSAIKLYNKMELITTIKSAIPYSDIAPLCVGFFGLQAAHSTRLLIHVQSYCYPLLGVPCFYDANSSPYRSLV